MDTGTASRREAIFILSRWLETGDFPDRLLPDSPDRGFVMDLVYGTVRQRRALAWVLSQLMQRSPGGATEAALLAGAFQVVFMEEVPAYAAVHATVEAAKIASGRSAGLVNGVLRNLVRRRAALLDGLAKQPLGIRLSHPEALLNRWLAHYGAADTEGLCRWNNTPAQTVIAWLPEAGGENSEFRNQNSEDSEPSGFVDRPATSGHAEPGNLNPPPPVRSSPPPALAPHPAAPDTCQIVPHGMRVDRLPGFAEGLFVVQDPATMAAVELLEVRPGMTVLDACAAPGGKTAQLAARLRGHGRLVAMDLHADRLVTLRSTLARTRQAWVEVVQGDAAAPADAAAPRFDRILVDVPCSNTGVLRRRPDARWRFSEQRLRSLAVAQQALLSNLLPRLAPGGRLVYSTCSLEPEENLRQVEAVLAAMPAARLVATAERLPFRDGTDGAFAAAITCS